jgi:sulfate permease, SulP family
MRVDQASFQRLFPFLTWAQAYDRDKFSRDFIAALIVVVMLVPQALGYAMVAGMPPYAGLYVSMLPAIMYCVFGTSMFMAVGVCAIIAIMTAAGAGSVAAAGTPEYVAAAAILALMSGCTLIVMGALRLGFVTNFISHTVISGFVTGSVLTIAATQVKHLLGVSAKGETLYDIAVSVWKALDKTHYPTVLFGALSLAAFILARRYLKSLLQKAGLSSERAGLLSGMGPFAIVSAAILITAWFDLDALGIKVVGHIPSGLPSLALPYFDADLWMILGGQAALIAIIVFVESVSIAQAFAVKRKQRIEPNQELIALGVAGIAASVSGGYPVAGSFSRSAVNYNAGAQTPAAGIFAAIGIALVASFFTQPLFHLPLATLAAMIVLAALTLVDFHILRKAWTYSKRDFMAVVATFLMTVLFGVERGLMTGMILSIALHIYLTSRPNFAVLGLVPGTHHFRDSKRNKVVTSDQIVSLRIDESLYFANANYLEEVVNKLITDYPNARHLILTCPAVNHIDMSALDVLESINRRLKEAGITLHLSEIKGPIMDRLKRSNFLEELTGQIFLTHYDAVVSLDPGLQVEEARHAPARLHELAS